MDDECMASNIRAQSALQYVLSYGWTIVIILVVLGGLYSLGVFNSTNFAPRAQPGSCQVQRPLGAGSTQIISLQGSCNNQIPKFTASFSGSGNVYAPVTLNTNSLTISFWVDPSLQSNTMARDLVVSNCIGGGYWGVQTAGGYNTNGRLTILEGWITGNQVDSLTPTNSLSNGRWAFITVAYDRTGGALYYYYNGMLYASASPAVGTAPTTTGLTIGNNCNGGPSALLADVMVFNKTLASTEVQTLYTEGIGGAPIDIRNLMVWIPLNGNPNDYSGNGNNGQVVQSGISFTDQWTTGYTYP